MTHKTKGIILRTVKYGESSIITTVFTEIFGVQSYIIKGVRQSSKKNQNKISFFQSSAILDMVVYHNDLKNLQFIKEYQWNYMYENIFSDVIKNAVAMYIIELLQHSLKQPETNSESFSFVEETLINLDKGSTAFTANLPLYFTLHLGSRLGFKIQGAYSKHNPVLDLQEGKFANEIPHHPYYVDDDRAKITSQINEIKFYADIEKIYLNKNMRRELLQTYQQYIRLHIDDFGEMRSLKILQEILS